MGVIEEKAVCEATIVDVTVAHEDTVLDTLLRVEGEDFVETLLGAVTVKEGEIVLDKHRDEVEQGVVVIVGENWEEILLREEREGAEERLGERVEVGEIEVVVDRQRDTE